MLPLHSGGRTPKLAQPKASQSPCSIPHVALFIQLSHFSEQSKPNQPVSQPGLKFKQNRYMCFHLQFSFPLQKKHINCLVRGLIDM